MNFFPRPGCILERAAFTRGPGPPLATAETVELRTSWTNILTFRKRLTLLRANGLRIRIPSQLPPARSRGSGGPRNVIGEFIGDGAVVEFVRDGGTKTVPFILHRLALNELGPGTQVRFSAVLDIPHPPGRVMALGSVGPFVSGALNGTPATGQFELTGARLDRYDPLRGIVAGKGRYEGVLGKLQVSGEASIAGFAAHRTASPVDLSTLFEAVVDGTSGDVALKSVQARFLRTHLMVVGGVESPGAGKGKTVSLRLVSSRARVEDLFRIATRSGRSALTGPMAFRAGVKFRPGSGPFLENLHLDGAFQISNASWTRPNTQIKIDDLSARARGEKEQAEDGNTADRVLTDLKGTVAIRNGVATLSQVAFRVPGAAAAGGGTFHLVTKQVDFRGTVSMAADVSEAASGFKSLLLKPFNFAFRKKGDDRGAVLPVSITGKFPRPRYRVALRK